MLGRLVVKDLRDEEYPIQYKGIEYGKTARYWYQDGWKGDQKRTPQCVGYAWTHWLEDGPVTHKTDIVPMVNPTIVYNNAQKLDKIPGENYDGTTIRAGAKYLKSLGWIKEYRWTQDVNTLASSIIHDGPVVIGTWWFNTMYETDKTGMIKVGGFANGGHAYVCNGVNLEQAKFRIKNSWGENWGNVGSAYIRFEDMEKLLKMDGECCLAIEISDSNFTENT